MKNRFTLKINIQLSNFTKKLVGLPLLTLLVLSSFANAQQIFRYTDAANPNGAGTFKVPSCVNQITVEAWGAGGGGGFRDINSISGTTGGGGGAYSKIIINDVKPGSIYSYKLGKGGAKGKTDKDGGNTTFSGPGTGPQLLIANGGKGSLANTTDSDRAAGGTASTVTGTTSYKGGDGGYAYSSPRRSGGGGGAATRTAAGGNAIAKTSGSNQTQWSGGTSQFPGGAGGDGAQDPGRSATVNVGGSDGTEFGGGGSGGWKATNTIAVLGGAGGNGGIIITYSGNKTFKMETTGEWNTGANWLTEAVPLSTDCVNIPSSSVVNVNAPLMVAKNVTIEGGATFNIKSAASLTVSETINNLGTINTENGGSLATNSTFSNNGQVNVRAGSLLTVAGKITNSMPAANFVIASDANLIQSNNVANTGAITVQRAVTDMDNQLEIQMDYVYWSSPVAGQNLQTFSPGTPLNRIYEYKESTDFFVKTPDTTFQPGKGYAIRAEVSTQFPAQPAGYSKTYPFVGVPNNGDYDIVIKRTPDTGARVHGYNMVGNPYPSNITFTEFYRANADKIYNTAWFWTNNNLYQKVQNGPEYTGNNYAIYNGTGGNNAPSAVTGTAGLTSVIKVGQGFLVQSKGMPYATATINFKNSYGANGINKLRVATTGTFYQRNSESVNRFWLILESPSAIINSQLVGYIPEATDGFDQDYDAEAFNLSSDLFYSILEDKNLLIQGKGDFRKEDKVILGANLFSTGTYKISVETPEGIFAQNQKIYLKDNVKNTHTDLKAGSYSFEAEAGLTEGRFEIVYQPEIVLSTGAKSKDKTLVYRNGNSFTIESAKNMKNVEVYEATGRLINKINISSKKTDLAAESWNTGIYLFKIDYEDGSTQTKKVIK